MIYNLFDLPYQFYRMNAINESDAVEEMRNVSFGDDSLVDNKLYSLQINQQSETEYAFYFFYSKNKLFG